MQIDSETMKLAVSKAILDSLGPEGQRLILEGAVSSLLEKGKSQGYSTNQKTVIQEMFTEQVQFTARGVIRHFVDNDEATKERIRSIVMTVTEKVLGGEELTDRLAEIVTRVVGQITLDRERY